MDEAGSRFSIASDFSGKLPRFGVKRPGLEVEDSGELAAIILAVPNPRSTF